MLLACTLAGGHVKEKVNRYFLLMLALNAAGALTEFLLPLQVLLPGAVMQNMAMQVLRNAVAASDYVFACGTFITFTAYLHTFLSGSGKVSKKPFIAMACINFLQLPVYSVMGLHNLLSGRGAQTRFLAQAQVQIIATIMMLSVLTTIVAMLRHIRSHRLKTRVWLSLILYVMVPFLALLPEFFFQGIWLSWLGSPTPSTTARVFFPPHFHKRLIS